jgi:hypothetical protein
MGEPDPTAKREWHFRQLKWALQALAIPAPDQRRLFPDFVVVADELALDFDHWQLVVLDNYDGELSTEQTSSLAEIDRTLGQMSGSGADELWTELALSSSQHWADLRRLAGAALKVFGWPVESPPRDPHERGVTFVR